MHDVAQITIVYSSMNSISLK